MSTPSLILDLEDSVPFDEKNVARDNISKLDLSDIDQPIFLRISPEDDVKNYEEDLELVSSLDVFGCVLPKVRTRQQVLDLKYRLGDRKMILLIEDFKTLQNLSSIIDTDVFGISLGLEDLLSDIPYFNSSLSNFVASLKSELAKVAFANGIIPIDSISTNYTNEGLFRAECITSRGLGYQSKFVIHPDQVSIADEVFSPNDEEVLWAKAIMKRADDFKGGYTKKEGMVLSPPKVNKAENILTSNEQK